MYITFKPSPVIPDTKYTVIARVASLIFMNEPCNVTCNFYSFFYQYLQVKTVDISPALIGAHFVISIGLKVKLGCQ